MKDTYHDIETSKSEARRAYEARQQAERREQMRHGIAVSTPLGAMWSAADPQSPLARVTKWTKAALIIAALLIANLLVIQLRF